MKEYALNRFIFKEPKDSIFGFFDYCCRFKDRSPNQWELIALENIFCPDTRQSKDDK